MQRQTGGSGGNTSYYALDTAMFDGYGVKLRDTDAFTGGVEPTRDAMGFQGQFGGYTDNETGLVLMGHRYYDAGTGRFLTRDPKGYGGGINLYGFTGNNPVNEMDPDGLDPLLTLNDFKEGIGTGWAGFSTSVWNTPGLSNLNRKYDIYSAGDYANQPGFKTSVTLGTIGITVLPIPIGGKLAIAMRAAKAARVARLAPVAQIVINNANGVAGQGRLLGLVGGAQQVFFRTSLGSRFVDVLDAANIAHESKVGYTVLSNSITRQVLKDAELLSTGQVRGVTWHFFRSPATGLRGASQPLLNELARHGIGVVFH